MLDMFKDMVYGTEKRHLLTWEIQYLEDSLFKDKPFRNHLEGLFLVGKKRESVEYNI
jgi:hypothetical protein